MNYTNLRNALYEKKPLVHAITNPISITLCANSALALGARPIMAEHPCEVGEITQTADALLLNLGNITDARMTSMLISSEIAQKRQIPACIDAVGVACSSFRKRFFVRLTQIFSPSVIKGNYSEIYALNSPHYSSSGVDSDKSITVEDVSSAATQLARKYGSVILASGKTDIITDGRRIAYVKNGVPELSSVTGTGCMLGMLCACFLTVSESFDAAVVSAALLGICGEKAVTDKGSASFLLNLMDMLSTLPSEEFRKYLKKEELILEKI